MAESVALVFPEQVLRAHVAEGFGFFCGAEKVGRERNGSGGSGGFSVWQGWHDDL